MAVTYGFYDSLNHDRLYNAQQMSAIFDGIINDGVFMSVGNQFHTVAGTGMQVIVKSGRAWFDSTWTLNDAEYPLSIDAADVLLTRIDAVVLEVNSEVATRANTIKVVKGTPASTPAKPTLTNTATIHQHALAYVTVAKNTTAITNSMIEIVVGKTETPYVTAILQTTDITDLFKKWENDFQVWFETVRSTLDGDVALNLQNQINNVVIENNAIKENIKTIEAKTNSIGLISYDGVKYPYKSLYKFFTYDDEYVSNADYGVDNATPIFTYHIVTPNMLYCIESRQYSDTSLDKILILYNVKSGKRINFVKIKDFSRIVRCDNDLVIIARSNERDYAVYQITENGLVLQGSFNTGNYSLIRDNTERTLVSHADYMYILGLYENPSLSYYPQYLKIYKLNKNNLSLSSIDITPNSNSAYGMSCGYSILNDRILIFAAVATNNIYPINCNSYIINYDISNDTHTISHTSLDSSGIATMISTDPNYMYILYFNTYKQNSSWYDEINFVYYDIANSREVSRTNNIFGAISSSFAFKLLPSNDIMIIDASNKKTYMISGPSYNAFYNTSRAYDSFYIASKRNSSGGYVCAMHSDDQYENVILTAYEGNHLFIGCGIDHDKSYFGNVIRIGGI